VNARKAWLAEFRDRVALAQQLGCDCVGMWPGGGLRGQTIDLAIEQLAGAFREAGRIAEDAACSPASRSSRPSCSITSGFFTARIIRRSRASTIPGISTPASGASVRSMRPGDFEAFGLRRQSAATTALFAAP